ncbi:MAG: DUF6010 family protein [Pseudomonadota bacterium]
MGAAAKAGFVSRPYLTGLLGGLLALAPHAVLPDAASIAYAAILMGLIAGIYIGFALQKGTESQVLVEVSAAGLFALAALVGGIALPIVIPIAYFAHGLWDAAHHARKRGDEFLVQTPRWYPPFCAVVDWVVALGLFVLWWRAGLL